VPSIWAAAKRKENPMNEQHALAKPRPQHHRVP
jgi:hypothetical protein